MRCDAPESGFSSMARRALGNRRVEMAEVQVHERLAHHHGGVAGHQGGGTAVFGDRGGNVAQAAFEDVAEGGVADPEVGREGNRVRGVRERQAVELLALRAVGLAAVGRGVHEGAGTLGVSQGVARIEADRLVEFADGASVGLRVDLAAIAHAPEIEIESLGV